MLAAARPQVAATAGAPRLRASLRVAAPQQGALSAPRRAHATHRATLRPQARAPPTAASTPRGDASRRPSPPRAPPRAPRAAFHLHLRGGALFRRADALTWQAAAEAGAYVASNRYRIVEAGATAEFEAEHGARRASAQPLPGFVSYELRQLPPVGGCAEYASAVTWRDKPSYEAWMNTPARRRSHLPHGVWQYRTANKFSVPEEFCPFVTETTAGAAEAM